MTVTIEQVDGLADAIMWARMIVRHECRGKAEIQHLKTLLLVLDKGEENDKYYDKLEEAGL